MKVPWGPSRAYTRLFKRDSMPNSTFCVAALAMLVSTSILMPPVMANQDVEKSQTQMLSYAPPSGAAQAAASTTLVNAKLESASQGLVHLSLAPASPEEKAHEISLSPEATITLNGSPAKVSELKSGDDLQLTNDADGDTIRVTAVRSRPAIVMGVDGGMLRCTTDYLDRFKCPVNAGTTILINGKASSISDLKNGDQAEIVAARDGSAIKINITRKPLLNNFLDNFRSNLFKPLLLFFYLGFAIALLKIAFDFPRPIYQGLTIYLLLAIGWHGGEELSMLSGGTMGQALLFMVTGFVTNTLIACAAYFLLRTFVPSLRRLDSATVAAYYGSDSAGTFVTCLGVLQAAHIAFAAYMPVMLAIMEIPGCLAGLYLVSRLRKGGMDALGNMPGERGYDANTIPSLRSATGELAYAGATGAAGAGGAAVMERGASTAERGGVAVAERGGVAVAERGGDAPPALARVNASSVAVAEPASGDDGSSPQVRPVGAGASAAEAGPGKVLREVFLNPGIALLFGGIVVGFLSRSQGYKVVQPDDQLFVSLFQGMLCLFLLEMGMTAAKRLQDLKTANWRFIAFGLLAPNVFAITGMCVACLFSHLIGQPLQLGTYVLFAVLSGSASYIAVPAIQRMAIPEASPTLPLAASLGLTFSYNVTIGIPLYLILAQELVKAFPVGI